MAAEFIFVLFVKNTKKVYVSKSFKQISKESGFNYHTLNSYLRDGVDYYEELEFMFSRSRIIKSKQGGKRDKKNIED